MKKVRYFIESGLPEGKLPTVHGPAYEWHAVRLNKDTVFGVAHFTSEAQVSALGDHPTCILFPSLHDRAPALQHLRSRQATKHAKVLASVGIVETDEVIHTVRKILQKTGFVALDTEW